MKIQHNIIYILKKCHKIGTKNDEQNFNTDLCWNCS